MFKFIKINCQEANDLCNKSQYEDISFFEKIKLNIHLMHCKICALYTKQNQLLTKTYKQKAKTCNLDRFELDGDAKKELEELLKKQAS